MAGNNVDWIQSGWAEAGLGGSGHSRSAGQKMLPLRENKNGNRALVAKNGWGMRGRTFLWGSGICLLAVAGGCFALAWRPEIAPIAVPNPSHFDAAIIEQGAQLAAVGNCIACHTVPGGKSFAGGLAVPTPFGTIYSSNITPDSETGIGPWTAADLRKAMHEGISRGGKRLFPAFPYTSFTKVSDQDVDALYAYLRSLKAVRYSPPANGFLFSQRWAMAVWNAIFFEGLISLL